ncbi:autophagy protein 12-like [Belonocnema kinseyi]|uniref:autophagy protein 12-like n=1 Tax=Belonocnema kinseyi TaxID=2817044 RepID=UPI00143D7F64|nr:autophagy protein 12-like [Belonocnema kinseyi]XP_033214219.1 autophagy protein 12-like [Belonocnema kinseyi]
MADTEQEGNSTVDDNSKPEAPDSLANEEPQEPACAETNFSGNEHAQATAKDKSKIDILLKATGDAPIMKKKKWAVNPEKHIGSIGEFIKKYIKLEPNERLFLYINQTFAPAPDQTVQNLYDCYGTDGKLIIHYCKTQAWG